MSNKKNNINMKMPKNCLFVDNEEMYYIEASGTVRVIASSHTVQAISVGGVGLIGSILGEALGGPVAARAISAGLSALIFNVILEASNYNYKPIDVKFTNALFPDATINLNNIFSFL